MTVMKFDFRCKTISDNSISNRYSPLISLSLINFGTYFQFRTALYLSVFLFTSKSSSKIRLDICRKYLIANAVFAGNLATLVFMLQSSYFYFFVFYSRGLIRKETNMNHQDRELDVSNADRGVWLVKVPKYVATRWEKAQGNVEVGKLKICKQSGQKAQVELSLSDGVMSLKEPAEENIPRDHRLDVSPVTHQTLGVFSHTVPSNLDGVIPEPEKLCMEGRIVQKLECRPYADNTYMKLKLETIRKASLPVRQVKQLDRVVQNYKPISDHKNNLLYSVKKKEEGKKVRDDKDAVLNMLFAAFEKHQYYNIKDLVKITNQPVVYLKEILNEVCNYNLKNPHKNMWELKPEYRHYKEADEEGKE